MAMRGGAAAARRPAEPASVELSGLRPPPHKLEVAGSNPATATISTLIVRAPCVPREPSWGAYFVVAASALCWLGGWAIVLELLA